MDKELIENIKEEIKETMGYFDDDRHFDDVFEQAGHDEYELRIFDCGFVRGLEYALNKLQEHGEAK